MKKQTVAILTIIAAGMIAGCGSGGTTSMMSPQGGSRSSISGKVADGYLAGATVFMDKNGNYQLDAGEPSATTDQNGAYTLMNVDPADVGKYPIVVLAMKDMTIDMDNPTQKLTSSYVLSMPATAVSGTVNSNFISPMTTQIREMMETGTYITTQQAMDALRAKMGLAAGTNVMSDYMAANNTAMHAAAQNMAGLMGSQMTQVLSSSGSTASVDVNRYRGMMGTIFSNISSVKVPNASMTTIMSTMATALSNVPASSSGMPFKNMSTTFRGMMGGINTISGGMMGR